MSRQRKQTYRSRLLADLSRQLLYSPPQKRAEVVRHAEQLHDELDENKNYPFEFVVYRLTDRRVPPNESVMLVGEAIKPDLRLLIDALSRSIEMTCEETDPGATTAELAEQLGVSTKTIARWRDAGLRWRWAVRDLGDKHKVMITRSALTAFEQTQEGRLANATAFTRLSEDEKEQLIFRARRLAAATDQPAQAILSHLAKRTGRSLNALRVLIRQHDEQHPTSPVFPDHSGPLTAEQKQAITLDYQNGATVSALCQRYNKTRSTIYRSIHESRAQRIAQMPLSAVYSPTFDRDDADEVLMHPIVRQGDARQLGADVIDALPAALKPIYEGPIEPDDVVRSLIVRYNFLKHRAIALQNRIIQSTAIASDLDAFDRLLDRINAARGEAIAAVLPIALSVVRRQQITTQQGGGSAFMTMLSTAHRMLIEELDRYDPGVAHPFESVLTNRLMRILASPTTTKRQSSVDAQSLVNQLAAAGFNPED